MKNLPVSISVILGTVLGPVIYLFSTEWSLLFAGLIAGSVAFLFGEKMLTSNIIILAIIATSIATYISRFMGALTSEKVSVNQIFLSGLIVYLFYFSCLTWKDDNFSAGVLAESELITRLIVFFVCIAIFIISKKNLVIPTILSAILLSTLNSL